MHSQIFNCLTHLNYLGFIRRKGYLNAKQSIIISFMIILS